MCVKFISYIIHFCHFCLQCLQLWLGSRYFLEHFPTSTTQPRMNCIFHTSEAPAAWCFCVSVFLHQSFLIRTMHRVPPRAYLGLILEGAKWKKKFMGAKSLFFLPKNTKFFNKLIFFSKKSVRQGGSCPGTPLGLHRLFWVKCF